MNIGTFCGRIGKDATLNRISSGDPVCNFSVAVDIGSKQTPKTMWVECAIYGKRGEALQQYLIKGKEVTVHGRVTLDSFTARDGTPKSGLKLNVVEISMHGGNQAAQAPAQGAPAAVGGVADMDDDVPF